MYPNNDQIILINKNFGCVRFVYNYFLNKCKNNKYYKAFDMCKELKELYVEYPLLKEVAILALKINLVNKVIELTQLEVVIKEIIIVISKYIKILIKLNYQN